MVRLLENRIIDINFIYIYDIKFIYIYEIRKLDSRGIKVHIAGSAAPQPPQVALTNTVA